MANNDFTPYKLSTSAEEADKGIVLAALAAKTPGILIFDGHGGAKSAVPGNDYGLPMINGNGPPSANTAATLGQHYFNMLATRPPYEYICTGLIESGYVWRVYGDTGVNFAPVGRFLTLDDLQAAIEAGLVPEPTPGVAYYIGTAAPYDVYAYDGVANNWLYIGKLTNTDKPDSGGKLPPHGDAGTILTKASAADYDTAWLYPVDAINDNSLPGAKIADGSVTTPKYANGSVTRAKLANDALYSPFAYTSRLTNEYIGRTLQNTLNTPAAVSVSTEDSRNIPDGAEFALFRWGNAEVDVTFEVLDTQQIWITGETKAIKKVKVSEPFGMIAIKKVDATKGGRWLATGNVEVVTWSTL